MNKSDLKPGHAVVLKNGVRGIISVFYDEVSGQEKLVVCVEIGGGYQVDEYDESLKYPTYHEVDISMVLGFSQNHVLALSFKDFADRPVLWSRRVYSENEVK